MKKPPQKLQSDPCTIGGEVWTFSVVHRKKGEKGHDRDTVIDYKNRTLATFTDLEARPLLTAVFHACWNIEETQKRRQRRQRGRVAQATHRRTA